MAIELVALSPGDRSTLEQLKGQVEANRLGHDAYVEGRDAGDKALMDANKPSFEAFEIYAEQYRAEATRLGVTEEPEPPLASTQPMDRRDVNEAGKIPKKADKDAAVAIRRAGTV